MCLGQFLFTGSVEEGKQTNREFRLPVDRNLMTIQLDNKKKMIKDYHFNPLMRLYVFAPEYTFSLLMSDYS